MDPTVGRKDEEDAEESEAEVKSEREEREAANPPGVRLQRRVYRAHLVSLEQEAQEAYDKAILTLSGGALGLSLVAIKDYLSLRGGAGAGLIVLALLCWALSVSCALFSFVSIRRAFESAIGREDPGTISARSQLVSARVASGLRIGAGVLFFGGVVFFAAYVASWPGVGGKQQPVSAAREEIARVLSLYDTIRETCPDCPSAEAQKVLQVCEGSYVVPEVLRQACPHCTDKAIVQLNHRCMEKWNSAR